MKITVDSPEEWRAVAGFPKYEVSNMGRIRSLPRDVKHSTAHSWFKRPGKILTHSVDRGYCIVTLLGECGARRIGVHRLVAGAFCDKPEGCDVVNHIDFNRANNCANNLEWTTRIANHRHSVEAGRFAFKVTQDSAKQIADSVKAGERPKDVADRYGLDSGTVRRIARGVRWGHITKTGADK